MLSFLGVIIYFNSTRQYIFTQNKSNNNNNKSFVHSLVHGRLVRVEQILGLVELGGDVGRAAAVRMVDDHDALVCLFDLEFVGIRTDAENERSLASGHLWLKAASVVLYAREGLE